jgi:hypothetical protein
MELRILVIENIRREVKTWKESSNSKYAKISCQFTTKETLVRGQIYTTWPDNLGDIWH